MKRRWLVVLLVCLSGAVSARAAAAPASADAGASADASAVPSSPPPPALDAGVADAEAAPGFGSCVEHVPGKEHPALVEKVPSKGTAGHVVELSVVVEHGKGETVLPNGFHMDFGSDEAKAFERAGFFLPDPDGGAGPVVNVTTKGDRATTTVRIPFVPLPDKPGRQHMVLPPVPIAIARASGEVITLCTSPHPVVVDDPTSNTPNAKPHGNPPPRPQREEWTLAKNIAVTALIALVIGALVAWLIGRWLKRPKPEPAPPPPRPPWEVALEELFDIRHAGLIVDQRFRDHYDRVSHTVRKYLGDRYGFDGLESTTREIMTVLEAIVPPVAVLPVIWTFLREADLVKFARLTPSEQDCETALARGEEIVQATVPPRFGPGAEPLPTAGVPPSADAGVPPSAAAGVASPDVPPEPDTTAAASPYAPPAPDTTAAASPYAPPEPDATQTAATAPSSDEPDEETK